MLIAAVYAPLLSPGDGRIIAAHQAVDEALGLPPRNPETRSSATQRSGLAEDWGRSGSHFARLMGLSWYPGTAPVGLYALLEFSEAEDLVARSEQALGALSEALSAFWGILSPEKLAAAAAGQIQKPGSMSPPLGLPALKNERELPPEIPQRLGWINYWSKAAADAIGLSESALAELRVPWRRTRSGWIVRLSEAPLDLDDAGDVGTLRAVYAQFPAIGGRSP